MKKIIIIGCPGGGKSTFARSLHKKTGIPLYYLDMMYWNPDKTKVAKESFRSELAQILLKDSYIIDGNYRSTMEIRLQACDTVFFLDYDTETCISGVISRMGKPRADMPWIETEEDTDFTDYIKTFYLKNRPEILTLLEAYRDKNIIIFKSREESAKYLESL
jgi:adenylate kinase family enzyme